MGIHGFDDCPFRIADFDGAGHPLVVYLDRLVGLCLGSRRSLVRDGVIIALRESRETNENTEHGRAWGVSGAL